LNPSGDARTRLFEPRPIDHLQTGPTAGPEHPDEGVPAVADETPSDLRYTEQHEWIREDDDHVTVGITRFAQDQLGDVVYVDLPSPGAEVTVGEPFGEVESTKSVSDLYAPVTGVVVERNEDLDERPELVNLDPYGEGWLVRIRVVDRDTIGELLDADTYRQRTVE
jgi:glycine cleavage system H protein